MQRGFSDIKFSRLVLLRFFKESQIAKSRFKRDFYYFKKVKYSSSVCLQKFLVFSDDLTLKARSADSYLYEKKKENLF